MQSFDGATWPPGAQCEFLGIADIGSDGTLNFSTNLGNGQPVVTGSAFLGGGQYELDVTMRPSNSVPYILVMIKDAINQRFVSMVANSPGPPAQIIVQISDSGGEGDAAPFVAFIFAAVPPVTFPAP
jgi:hypothetical protein